LHPSRRLAVLFNMVVRVKAIERQAKSEADETD
jgi:hypothetical protein